MIKAEAACMTWPSVTLPSRNFGAQSNTGTTGAIRLDPCETNAHVLARKPRPLPQHVGESHYLINSDDSPQFAAAGLDAAICYAKALGSGSGASFTSRTSQALAQCSSSAVTISRAST
jgi:hypothetical protein